LESKALALGWWFRHAQS